MADGHRFWVDNVIFGGASFLSGLINYLYHVVLAHVLGPDGYGDLTAFLNVTSVLLLPAPVVTLVYTRLGRRRRRPLEVAGLWGGGVALWGLLVLLQAPLARALHVSGLLLVVFGFEVVPSLALAANLGLLQRAEWYVWVGAINVANNGFRVLAAAGAAWLRLPLVALGWLEAVAAWVAYGASRVAAGRLPALGEEPEAGLVVGTATAGVVNVLFSLADGLVAKARLPALQAGWFNGLATIGHTVQFVSGSLGTVLLTSILAQPGQRRRYLAVTLALYGAVGAVAETGFLGFGRPLVYMVLGMRFAPIVRWLPVYGLSMVALGFLNLFMQYSVARRRWAVVAAATVGLAAWVVALGRASSLGGMVEASVAILVGTLAAAVGLTAWPRLGRIRAWP